MMKHFVFALLISLSVTPMLAACDNDAEAQEPDEMSREEMISLVQNFYDLLSDPTTSEADARTAEFMDDDWASTPTPLGGPGRAGFVTTLGAFGQLIPDLDWEVQEMLVDGDRVVVRSLARGTPAGPFLGVDPATGRSFEIMTIDIHTVEDGLMVRSYHVEDWATAMAQLTAAE